MIRTVLGDIETTNGNILIHEHILCLSNDMLCIKNDWADKKSIEDYSVKVLKALHEELNISVFVDGTPWDLGRDVELLKRISERSGVYIVASSGLYYFSSLISHPHTAEKLAEFFIDECANGIGDTRIKPGILKCAVGGDVLTDDEKKRISALAITQRETGLPLYAHSYHKGNVTEEIIDLFIKNKACLDKVVIGHTGLRPEADFLESILKTGVHISVDQCFSGCEFDNAKAVFSLCKRGWQDKIMCSLDHVIYSDFASLDENKGLSCPFAKHVDDFRFIFNNMSPAFEKFGCTKEECQAFIHKNPLNFFALNTK